MTTLACIIRPSTPPSRIIPLARAVEAAGIEEIWLWEDCFQTGGISAAGAILSATDHVRVGIGVMPTPLRNVALTAMEVATVDGMFPGRLIPGIGHGVQSWMAQVGGKAGSPLTLMREYATALRALLAGERVTTSGRYVSLDDVALDWPPARPVPVPVAATGPRSLRLAGEVGDGVVLEGSVGLAGLPAVLERIAEGRAAAGHDPSAPFPVIQNVSAATGPDAAARLRAELTAWGQDVADDAGLATYAVWGDAQAIADGVRRYGDAGAHTVALQPTEDEPDLERFIEVTGAAQELLRQG
ncbi:LLM class flavin-dependent oxidoreductase [Promicromonospora iranensis]|uniref:Alkanesulfonate monooxygenase SsuD/methylene tetrahydromethanopterin reductase-like flavin-dependent oxidoreductase (Luciferase family) n=1 Tax=Promicromonospora iranensis TaxID=1105144 RepID=A0ABU2CNV0_9MICO|nr:LLM class flavin-dependent oxidoreductase [Promicromonospora iranensis]MDR7383015.1 alkanesulfonate monooxygenase SsuD/methylene tetrahydromethanopterin reductase-like flavin-dependent oxidoreductase (luciferase family) [Promicromonospora iranensis]